MAAELAVAGVGMTRFTKQAERGHAGLAAEAVGGALEHAGLRPADVGAAFCASVGGGVGIGQRVLKDLGVAGVPITNIENACASGPTALRNALAWITAGFADCVLVVGVEILSARRGPLAMPEGRAAATGLNLPGWYALKARRHMATYGLTAEDLASVAVKSRRLARHNPFAHFREPIDVDEVLAAPMVADPLTRPQCCPNVDGAAAAVVCSGDFARARGVRPVWIRGGSMVSGTHVYVDEPIGDAAARAATLAWDDAGVGPDDVDVVECHDAFTIAEILSTEALGICPEGEGGRYAAKGATSPGGDRAVVNPSGGLLSRGHPLGASGLGQVAEVVWQLRAEAGARQVPAARLGVVHTMGASEFDLDANACVMHVFEAGP